MALASFHRGTDRAQVLTPKMVSSGARSVPLDYFVSSVPLDPTPGSAKHLSHRNVSLCGAGGRNSPLGSLVSCPPTPAFPRPLPSVACSGAGAPLLLAFWFSSFEGFLFYLLRGEFRPPSRTLKPVVFPWLRRWQGRGVPGGYCPADHSAIWLGDAARQPAEPVPDPPFAFW